MKIEQLLKDYNNNKIQIENGYENIQSINEQLETLLFYKMDKVDVYDRVQELKSTKGIITAKLKHYQYLIDTVDRQMKLLNEIERIIIESYYIKGMCLFDIGEVVHYGDKWVCKLKKKALIKMDIK